MKFSGIPVVIALFAMSITATWAGGLAQFGAQDPANAAPAKDAVATKMAPITPAQSLALAEQYQQVKGKMAEKATSGKAIKRDRLRERLHKHGLVNGAAAKPRTEWQRKHDCPYAHKGSGKVNAAKRMHGDKTQAHTCVKDCCSK